MEYIFLKLHLLSKVFFANRGFRDHFVFWQIETVIFSCILCFSALPQTMYLEDKRKRKVIEKDMGT